MPWNPATLKRLREERALTQAALAALASTTRVTIARLETGARLPGVELLETLAGVLKVSVGELLDEPARKRRGQ
jgi:transcriptional regulator with XRE-family HTH domain